MKKIVIILMAVALMACSHKAKQAEEKVSEAPAELVVNTLDIGGMTCEHCVMSVTKGINDLEGIAEVKVTLDDSTAVVKYDASVVNIDDIKAAVGKRGYRVKAVE